VAFGYYIFFMFCFLKGVWELFVKGHHGLGI
jgi:hypothetical protein